MKTLISLLCCFLLVVLLAACMTPAQQSAALAALDQMRAAGTITAEQWEVMRQAILQGGTSSFWQQLLLTAGGMAATYVGIQVRRNATSDIRTAAVVEKMVPNAVPLK